MHPLDRLAFKVERSFKKRTSHKTTSLLGLVTVLVLASCTTVSNPFELILPQKPKTVLEKVTASNLSLANSSPDIIFKEQEKDPYEPLPPLSLEGVPAMK